jgi:hypothetical protein
MHACTSGISSSSPVIAQWNPEYVLGAEDDGKRILKIVRAPQDRLVLFARLDRAAYAP